MRKTLNDNPVVTVAVVGLLGLVVAFMLLHSMSSRSPGSAPATTTADATATAAPTTATPATTDPAAAAAATTTPATTDPATGAIAATAPAASTPAVGAFVAGPGLPKPVVDAYHSNRVVAIVVLKQNGIDDAAIAKATAPLHNMADVALFETYASKVARYSRVTEGVDLDRVPAIVVLRQKSLTKGPTPQATVSYGFKSVQSVAQTLHDATYKGANNLPSWPR